MEWRARLGLGTEDWKAHFDRRAASTRQVIHYFFESFSDGPILEVGCGTGAVTGHVSRITGIEMVALDLDMAFLKSAKNDNSPLEAVLGDGLNLPFKNDSFAAVLCSYFLVWQSDGAAAIKEMARVTRPKGMVAAVAEPDHTARIDYPEEFQFGPKEADAMRKMAGDPEAGRKLKAWMAEAGLERIEVGIIQTVMDDKALRTSFDAEWELRNKLLPDVGHLKEPELQAIWKGVRTTVVPVFYGRGYKSYNFAEE